MIFIDAESFLWPTIERDRKRRQSQSAPDHNRTLGVQIMATTTLQAESAPANPIVAAYLAARANEQRFDANQCQTENVEARLAQYAEGGGRDYAMSWGINDGEHAALVALLTADRLQHLIDGFSRRDDLDRRVVTFGIQELYEVERIKSALVNLWRHLDAGPNRKLKPLALDLGLIDKKDNARD